MTNNITSILYRTLDYNVCNRILKIVDISVENKTEIIDDVFEFLEVCGNGISIYITEYVGESNGNE